jgi:hypothetical protein
MEENLVDKNGKPLELQPKANHSVQGNYYQKWLDSNKEKFEPTEEDIKCELQLQALDIWEPLKFDFDLYDFKKQIKPYNDKWVPYLRREGVVNNREGLSLIGIEGDDYNDGLSMPEARKRHGRKLRETDFNTPNQLYKDLPVLHPMLEYFMPLGRTMLVKVNAGGWFPPHKDAPQLTRETFRIVAFLTEATGSDAYEWEMGGRRWPIVPGRAYYVDTRRTHRTHAWMNNSVHLVVNVPKTWENVMKLMSSTQYF